MTFEEYDFPGLKTQDGIADIGDYRAAWFRDSEGNVSAHSACDAAAAKPSKTYSRS